MALANQAIGAIKKKLGKRRLFYVCRDIERAAAGLETGLRNYKIITNRSALALELKKKFAGQVIIAGGNRPLDTQNLLQSRTAEKNIKKNDFVMVFKTTGQIEKICASKGWRLLNPPAKLASEVEEKISQVNWLGNLKKYLPLIRIDLTRNIRTSELPIILQFNRSHTGEGTYLMEKPAQLKAIQKKFPDREARVSKILSGPTITSNNVAFGKKVITGNVSYQITGLYPFTDNKYATIGNDWGLPKKILSKKQMKEFVEIAGQVGRKLARSGWRGLFGIDAMIDEKTKRVKLIEINARQPASTSFESTLQKLTGKKGITIFEAHLLSLFGLNPGKNRITKINEGAQLVQRITRNLPRLPKVKFYKRPGWRLIQYDNAELGEDLLRMQTAKCVMDTHGYLNEHGNELSICVSLAARNTLVNLPRAGMIIVRGNRLLLIERRRFGYHYFVLPGGCLEKKEDWKTAAKREIFEETGLRCKIDMTRKPVNVSAARDEVYYFAEKCGGRPFLGGPEKKRNSSTNHYALKFVEIAELKKINLLPPVLKKILMKILK